jgi:mRNA interferase RelE/StbE
LKYEIIWSDTTIKQIKKLEYIIARRIYKKVEELSENPYRMSTKLVGDPYFRLRVGDYRVIFEIENEKLRVLIVKIGHRSEVYA